MIASPYPLLQVNIFTFPGFTSGIGKHSDEGFDAECRIFGDDEV